MNNANELGKQIGQVKSPTKCIKRSHELEKDVDAERNSSATGKEHEQYGIFPLLDKAFNDTFGYTVATDDLKSNVKNDIHDEAYNKLSSHEQELLGLLDAEDLGEPWVELMGVKKGIRRMVPGWNGEPSRRVSDNGNKDQNNNETDENDDYEYKIANRNGPSSSSESGDSAEINDMVPVLGQRFNGESMEDKDAAEKKLTLGWLKRKLLAIEEDSVVDDRDDTESDYKEDKRWRVGFAGEFKHRGGSYRNEGDDDRDKVGDQAVDDYYHHSVDSHGDISDLGSFVDDTPLNRYAADMGDTAHKWNKANHKRKIVQEMNGRVDSRNDDKVTSFRKRKSAKPVGGGVGGMPPSSTTDKKEETIQDQRTVYRQQYNDSGQVETTTACDCAAKCSTTESSTNEITQETDTTEVGGVDEEVTTGKTETEEQQQEEEQKQEEQPQEEEQQEEQQQEEQRQEQQQQEEQQQEEQQQEERQQEEVEQQEEDVATDEPVDEPDASTKRTSSQQKEVYIDLKIGIKNVGNDSWTSQEEPIEFHRKIVVKRDEFENDMSQMTSSSQAAAPESQFPVDLVKAIYQLVDKDDSLRKHVAPRLPDRTKLLSKLEQPGCRQKINDHQLESTGDKNRASDGGSKGAASSVASIEDSNTDNKALASVIKAIGELIRKQS